MFNASFTKQQVANLIAQFGTTVAITSSGSTIYSGKAAFSAKKIKTETSDQLAHSAHVNTASAVAYIDASATAVPSPGDTLTGTNRLYRITAVDVYQPADVVIAYRLELE